MIVDELQLLAGVPIDINVCNVYPITLKEIVNVGEQQYNQYLSMVLFDKETLEVNDLNESNVNILAAICMYDRNFKEIFLKSLNFFTKEDFKLSDDGIFYIDNEKYFNNSTFNTFQIIIKKQNHIKDSKDEEIVAGNERAKKFMEELKKKKEKILKHKKQDINLASIISGVAWKSNNINIKNVWDLTVYQLHDAYYRLGYIDDYNYTVTGIYSGTVDGKKVNLNKINWAKVLNF